MSKALPERPDLGQLKKQAKDLRKAGTHPTLADAQRAIARDYGFTSWSKLKLHLASRADNDAENEFIRAALGGSSAALQALLNERPRLLARSIHSSAAAGSVESVREWLRRDPASATVKGGPRNWVPLLYLCFGRYGTDAERAESARLLLAAGADPNSHWIDPNWPQSPQAALYGATGVNNYPLLARVLLTAGANPNDGESRYHAAEHHHVACLEVLAEFGTDFSGINPHWQNTPLYFLFGWLNANDAVRQGIRWLLDHGADPNIPSHGALPLHRAVENGWEAAMVKALLDHGANPNARRPDGRSPFALAVRGGQTQIAALLKEWGADTNVSDSDQWLGACMAADETSARALLARHPRLISELSENDRFIPHQAAKEGRADALRLMDRLGVDVRIKGADGETALHWAGWYGQPAVIEALIEMKFDVNARERQFGASPVGWVAHGAVHCGNPQGDYVRSMALLIRAGAEVPPDTTENPLVRAASL